MLLLLGPVAGTVAAQATVAGRWHMRLSTGASILRGDLRLQQRGSVLTGTLALESSDDPPVAIRDGRIGAGGEIQFSAGGADGGEFSGRQAGAELFGQVTQGRGRSWQWTAQRLADDAEFYAALPRFHSAQLVIGRNVTELRLPGAWVAAADAEPGFAAQASALSSASGLTPIPDDSIRIYGFLPALGLSRRDELVPAMARALTTVRAALPQPAQAEFDLLFRPRGTWVVDLHDAALQSARRRSRNVTWTDAEPALSAAGLLPPSQPPGTSILPLALYRLAVLRERDSTAFQSARERLTLGGNASAAATEALLDGYRDAAEWQGRAVTFLLSAEWVVRGKARTSPVGLMRAAWNMPSLEPPPVRPRYFGNPEAVPRVGIPPDQVQRLVVPENWAGREWAARRGPSGMLDVLRRLELGVGNNTVLEADGPSLLTSVAREAAASPAGFLESTDEIIEDPGTAPLFAVATAVHEWQHLLMERARWSLAPGGALQDNGTGLRVVASDLFLAEGFAEWMTERVLAPVLAALPIVGVADLQKLAVLEADNPTDPHVLGLRMLRALAAATGRPGEVGALVIAHADAPADVAAAVPAWRDANAPARAVPVRAQRRLVPETQFSVEDGVGDVIGARIRVLADPPMGR